MLRIGEGNAEMRRNQQRILLNIIPVSSGPRLGLTRLLGANLFQRNAGKALN